MSVSDDKRTFTLTFTIKDGEAEETFSDAISHDGEPSRAVHYDTLNALKRRANAWLSDRGYTAAAPDTSRAVINEETAEGASPQAV